MKQLIFTMYLWACKDKEKFIITNAFMMFTLLQICKGESLSILCKDIVKNNLYNFCKDHKLGRKDSLHNAFTESSHQL